MAIPTLDVTEITNIFAKQVKVDSEVTADGGATITERGFVYSKFINPIV